MVQPLATLRFDFGDVGTEIGAPDWIRTSGLCLRRAALYPAELRVRGVDIGESGGCCNGQNGGIAGAPKPGGGGRCHRQVGPIDPYGMSRAPERTAAPQRIFCENSGLPLRNQWRIFAENSVAGLAPRDSAVISRFRRRKAMAPHPRVSQVFGSCSCSGYHWAGLAGDRWLAVGPGFWLWGLVRAHHSSALTDSA